MLKVGQRKNCVYRNDNHIEIKLYRFNYENIALPTWRRQIAPARLNSIFSRLNLVKNKWPCREVTPFESVPLTVRYRFGRLGFTGALGLDYCLVSVTFSLGVFDLPTNAFNRQKKEHKMSKKPSNNQSRGKKIKLNQFGDFHFYWFFVLYISFWFFFYNKITYI